MMRRASAPRLVARGRELVDRMRKANIALGKTARVVRRQDHLDAVVDVEPLGMMVHLLGDECHATHEAPGLAEGAEVIDLADGVAILHLGPAVKLAQRRFPRRARESLDHDAPPSLALAREVADHAREIKAGPCRR